MKMNAMVRAQHIDSLTRTRALTLAALILYVPANLYPILRITYYGLYSESTVWDGCVNLFRDGQWLVAVVVFLASILIPLFKLLGLLFVTAPASMGGPRTQQLRLRVHGIIATLGPWAMLDVFITAVLISLVKLGQFVTVLPGRGLLPFALVVVLTILASVSYDPEARWEQAETAS